MLPVRLLMRRFSVLSSTNWPSDAGTLPPKPIFGTCSAVIPVVPVTTPVQVDSGASRAQFSLSFGSSVALAASSISQSRTNAAVVAPPQGGSGFAMASGDAGPCSPVRVART